MRGAASTLSRERGTFGDVSDRLIEARALPSKHPKGTAAKRLVAVLLCSSGFLASGCDEQPSSARSVGTMTSTASSVTTPTPTPTSAVARPSTIPDPQSFDPAAQKLDPGLAAAYRLLQAGQYEDARKSVDAYSRGSSTRAGQAAFVVGLSYHRAKLYTAAVEHFLRALALEPGFAETYYYAGFALFNVGRLSEARAALAVYARYKPDDHATAFAQGLVEFEDDHVDEAARHIGRAVETLAKLRASSKAPAEFDGDLGRYRARLGDVLMRQDRVSDARATFSEAARLRPDSPEIWMKLANACERLGDRAGADTARRRYEEATAKRSGAGSAPR